MDMNTVRRKPLRDAGASKERIGEPGVRNGRVEVHGCHRKSSRIVLYVERESEMMNDNESRIIRIRLEELIERSELVKVAAGKNAFAHRRILCEASVCFQVALSPELAVDDHERRGRAVNDHRRRP